LLGKDKVHLVKYEDLVGESVKTLKAICDFCALEFEPDMLKFYEQKQSIELASKGGPRENIAKPILPSNFNKYRKVLSTSEIRSTEAYLEDMMKIFDYAPDSKIRIRCRKWSILKPMFMEPFERVANSELLPQYKIGPRREKKKLDSLIEPLSDQNTPNAFEIGV